MTGRLPSFLIIGAMKAGTTSLYRDLGKHPAIFLPAAKEPEALVSDAVFEDDHLKRYGDLFSLASADQLCGEASTAYTKLPDVTGVPQRALRLLGPDLRVVYLVREPVARIVSQHYHEWRRGKVGPDIDAEVRRHPRYLDYTRYAMQIDPWMDALGADRVLIVSFHRFVEERAQVVCEVETFLGLDARPDLVDAGVVHNRGETATVPRKRWTRVRENSLYRRLVRPFIPAIARQKIRERVMHRAPPRPPPPSADTVRWIRDTLADDHRRLEDLLGSRPWPPWQAPAAGDGTG